MQDLLVEVALELAGELVQPESRKPSLLLLGVIGVVFALVVAWLLFVVPDPLNEPAWGLTALAFAILYGAAGIIAGLGNLASGEPERGASLLVLVVSIVLVLLPVLGVDW
jgi:hypothetical protein